MVSHAPSLNADAQAALRETVRVLRQLAEYELKPDVAQRLHELGDRKEFLDTAEHDELLRLVEFSEERTLEKLEAMNLLKRLRDTLPEVLDES